MIAKKQNRSSVGRLTKKAAPPQSGEESDTVYVVGPIGIQGQPTSEEWYYLRNAMFDELRKFPIPRNLIDAVCDFQPYASVTWLNDRGVAAGPKDVLVEPVVEKPPKSLAAKSLSAAFGNVELFEASLPRTAGESLAVCLRYQLALANREAAAVRRRKFLAPSVIACIAMELLDSCALFDQPVGPELIALLRALLKTDRKPLKSSREFSERYRAAWILAQKPSIGTRQLARILAVNASSISRWRREPSFRAMVESKKESIQFVKERGLWPQSKKQKSAPRSI
jgi:hypothetical protein